MVVEDQFPQFRRNLVTALTAWKNASAQLAGMERFSQEAIVLSVFGSVGCPGEPTDTANTTRGDVCRPAVTE